MSDKFLTEQGLEEIIDGMAKKRTDIEFSDRWNVEALYSSLDDWDQDLKTWQGKETTPHWPELEGFKGKLKEGPGTLAKMLTIYFKIDLAISKLYTYAHLRHDEDVGNDLHKQAFMKILSTFHRFRQETSWIEPEILELPSHFLTDQQLQPYQKYLERVSRLKPHTLTSREEELLAMASFALELPGRAFGAFNNGDLKFPSVKDQEGKEQPLTHAQYATYLRSRDRVLRKNSFQTLHKTYFSWENTLCELIHGEVQQHLFYAKARRFKTCLEAALFPHNIPVGVYRNLIQTVRKNLKVLHDYLKFRKEYLKLDELHLWDLHVPLVSSVDLKIGYEEAEKKVIDSVAPLGGAYQQALNQGLAVDRWVDRYENLRKRSGAYSSGCFGSMPYILMNYQGNLQDMMTLAHEAGHSMHSYLSWKNQPYQDASYPIFVAEVASTFNEELLSRKLLASTTDSHLKAYLINQKIEDIRNTFFRQTMFAEFEWKIHELVEQGTPLTPQLLKEEYRKLHLDYFGNEVVIDAEIDIEWARIPHFYYNFYVYQYATGISAALALTEIVEKEGPDRYLQFLSSGGSRYPLDLLKIAGIDMSRPEPIEAAILRFETLVKQLKQTLSA